MAANIINVPFNVTIPAGGSIVVLNNTAPATQLILARVVWSADASQPLQWFRGTAPNVLVANIAFGASQTFWQTIDFTGEPGSGYPFGVGEGLYVASVAGLLVRGYASYRLQGL